METFPTFYHMEQELIERVNGVLNREPTHLWRSREIRFGDRSIHLRWVESLPDTLTLEVWEEELSYGSQYPFYMPQEAQDAELERAFEVLHGFEGTYLDHSFYGFGARLDADVHRHICELTGIAARLKHTGTWLDLGVVEMQVPHPFFRDRGARLSLKPKTPAFSTRAEMQLYREGLTRAAEIAELLARTLDV